MDALAPKYIDTRPQQKCVFPSALYKLWRVNFNDEKTSLMFSADLLVSYFSLDILHLFCKHILHFLITTVLVVNSKEIMEIRVSK